MTYKTATDLAQRRSRQLWLADLQGPEWEALPAEEQRANLVRSVKSLQTLLGTAIDGSLERVWIGKTIEELNLRINALRAKVRVDAAAQCAVERAFIDVARERMPPYLFRVYMREALKRSGHLEAPAE